MGNLENPTEIEFYYRTNSWDELLVADTCRGYEMKFSEGDCICSMNKDRTSAPLDLKEPVTMSYYSADKNTRFVLDCENSEAMMEVAIDLVMLSPPERVKFLEEHKDKR